MEIDVAAAIGAVTRSVQSLEHEGRPAKAVIATRSYPTTPADLWDAITNPDRIPRWFLPIKGEFFEGGTFQLEGNAGGKILKCTPEQALSVTWEYGGEVSWVNVTLTPDGDGTQLRLEHISPVGPHWDQFGPGAAGIGWDLLIALGLMLHLQTGAPVDPEDAQAWPLTEQGKDFIAAASASWGEAAIEAGEDPEKARNAAEACRKFYTGEQG